MNKPPAPPLAAVCGVLMGGADAIPGVSGGTIALILGIYERFIHALHTVIKSPVLLRRSEGRAELKEALTFLVPLAIGVVLAYYAATKLLVGPTEAPGVMRRPDTGAICYGFFFGLVLFSLKEPWLRIRTRGPGHYVAAAVFAAAAALFVGLSPSADTDIPTWTLVLGGAGAISVMLLPGVSGSLLLVIIGQYQVVAGAVHDRNVAVIAIFLLGIALGIVTFVPLLRALLRSHHDLTMAALTGLMAGSLRALWPWKDNYDGKAGPMENVGISDPLWVIVGVAGGIAVVFALSALEKRLR